MNYQPLPDNPQSDDQVWPPLVDLESIFKPGQSWPPESESQRLTTYKENIALRDNRFGAVWSDYNRLMREDGRKELSMWLGYLWICTKKSMDMLLGKPPIITTSSDSETANLESFLESQDIQQVLYEVMVDVDSLGDGLLKIYKDADGNVKLQSNSPDIWFPIVESGNLREFKYHVLADVFHRVEYDTDGTPKSKQYYLKAEIHSKEQIEHRIYQLDTAVRTGMTYTGMMSLGMSYTIQRQCDLADFLDVFPYLSELPDDGIEDNPIGDFLIIPIPGPRGSKDVYGRSSYGQDLKSILKALIDRYIEREWVLNKHGDPNMIGPKGMFEQYDPVTQKSIIRAGGKYFGYRWDPGMTPPDIHYSENQQLAAIMGAVQQDITDLTQAFLNLAEIPAVVLAGTAQGMRGAVSGTAYRLMLHPLVNKVERLERSLQPRALQALKLACRLLDKPAESVTIKFADPFPKIPAEEATRVMTLRNPQSPIISNQQALRELGYDDDTVDKIMEEMKTEKPPEPAPMGAQPGQRLNIPARIQERQGMTA